MLALMLKINGGRVHRSYSERGPPIFGIIYLNMSVALVERPIWFERVAEVAFREFEIYEPLLEVVLAASRLLAQGHPEDAKRICMGGMDGFQTCKNCGIQGEEESNQITQMICDESFPEDIRNRARRAWEAKHPDIPIPTSQPVI